MKNRQDASPKINKKAVADKAMAFLYKHLKYRELQFQL
jgi:hypothetical protein